MARRARGRFLLNGVGATRQGPRCQVALGRGCNRWCGLLPRRPWRLSIAITTGDMQDRKITTLSTKAEHPPRESADARIWMVSRRTAGIGSRHAPYRNAGHSGIDRETRQRPTAQKLRRSDRKQHRPLCNRRPRGKSRPLSYSTVPAGMTRDIAHHRVQVWLRRRAGESLSMPPQSQSPSDRDRMAETRPFTSGAAREA